MSHEGLRKIERGERIPSRETLDAILDVGKVPDKLADKLRRDRDKAQAERVGLSLPISFPDDKLRKISDKITTTLVKFLGELDLELPEKEKKDLHKRVETTLRKEICG
jgi:hypothetical protein